MFFNKKHLFSMKICCVSLHQAIGMTEGCFFIQKKQRKNLPHNILLYIYSELNQPYILC